MKISPRVRDLLSSLAIVGALLCLAAGGVLLAGSHLGIRLVAAVGGAALCVAGALFSGNPRLFCLWGLGFSIPFMFAKTFGPVINKGGGEVAFNIDVTDVFLLIFCAFLARDLHWGVRRGIRIPKPAYCWIGVMVLGAFTFIAGPYRTTAAHELVRMVKMLVLFLVLCQELESPRRVLHWCGAITSGLIVNAITGLAEYYYHTTFHLADLGEASEDVIQTLAATSVSGEKVWRVGAFLLHPNIFGAFLAALLPLTAACFLVAKSWAYKAYFLAAFVLGTGALIATQSRSGWISFSVAFACFVLAAITNRKLRRRSAISAAFTGVLLVGAVIAARGQIVARIVDSKEEALSFRGVFNEDAKRMIADSPLWGLGLNSYVLNVPNYARYRYGSWPPPAHHIYYLWWAETGLVGLCLHLGLWGGLVWFGIRNFRVKDTIMFAVNAACVFGLIAFSLDGFVSFSLRLTPTLKTFWTLGAVIMAIRYWRLRHEVYASQVTVRRQTPSTANRILVPLTLPDQLPS